MTKQCDQCKTIYDLDITPAQYAAWKSGQLIQKAMPHLTADERELLISGLCGRCFDKLFPPDEEELYDPDLD